MDRTGRQDAAHRGTGPRIAVGPRPAEWAAEAIRRGGGEPVTLDQEPEGLVWTDGAALDGALELAGLIAPGERTGQFRTGANTLIADADGNSRISAEDYAIAFVDELEQGRFIRQIATVAY